MTAYRMSPEQTAIIDKNYPTMSNTALAKLAGVHPNSVVNRARNLGLKKHPQVLKQLQQSALSFDPKQQRRIERMLAEIYRTSTVRTVWRHPEQGVSS